MRLPISVLTLAVAVLAVLPPPSASAGTYEVTACFGAENASWRSFKSAPGVVAYASCPGGIDAARAVAGEGLMVRNVMRPGLAAPGAAAGWRFDAPAGTTITGIGFDARVLRNPGWQAGLQDAATDRWLWCGNACSTSVGHWVHDQVRGLSTSHLATLVQCVASHCRRERLRAFVGLRNVRVTLSDPAPPVVGPLAGVGDGWIRGRVAIAADARDASGIRAERVDLDGRVIHSATRPCDFTRPVPCTGGALRASFDTRTWTDGAHRLRVGVSDAGGSWAWRERIVRVDNAPPSEPVVALDGGDAWSSSPARSLRVTVPGGQAAPVVRARLTICRAGRCAAPVARSVGARGAVAVGALGQPAEYAIRVALEDAAGNLGPAAPPVTVRFDDTVPGAPDLSAADVWLRGDVPLALKATGTVPPSGVAGFRVGTKLVPSLPLDHFREGTTPVEVRTVSGAGVASTAVRTLVRVDRTAPAVAASGVPSGDRWIAEPVHVGLRARDDRSGVARVAWQVGAGAESVAESSEATVALTTDGRHEVRYRALDAAGNASAAGSFLVRVDRTPPGTVAFEAQDPADPAQVRAVVADATSGVVSGTIELRPPGGAWVPLPSSLRDGRLVARLDDARLRAGGYELRARAVDGAGNTAVGTARTDGAPAVLTLPLRKRVTLTTSRAGRLVTVRLLDGTTPLADRDVTFEQRLRGRTTWRRICGRRTIVLAGSASGDPAATPSAGSSSPSTTSPAGATSSPACALSTDGAGRVRLRLRSGPSRTVRARFAGDALLLPARASVTVRRKARVRLRAVPPAVRAGASVTFRGRLLGGHLPAGGKLVDVQARVGARWRTFATVRTGRDGRVRHRHRFALSSSGRTYRFRVLARKETAYPYESGVSPAVAVRVL
jgi:hypothetical protein